MTDDLQRVFIHEMGHFIAAETNHRIFKYDRRIELIKLMARPNTSFFNGSVSTKKVTLDSYSYLTSANEYVQTFYGCLFEVIYRKIELNECLCSSISREEHLIHNLGNGKVDSLYIYSIGQRPEIKKHSKEWYSYITNDYYNQMLSLNSHFDEVFKIDVYQHILKKDGTIYWIDINELLKSTNHFIESHSHYFELLMHKLYEIQEISK